MEVNNTLNNKRDRHGAARFSASFQMLSGPLQQTLVMVGDGSVSIAGQGTDNLEASTVTRRAFTENTALEKLDRQIVNDIQAKAGSTTLPAGGEKRVENPVDIVLWDTLAIVAELDGKNRIVACCVNRHASGLTVAIGMADGIDNQIGDNLGNRTGI